MKIVKHVETGHFVGLTAQNAYLTHYASDAEAFDTEEEAREWMAWELEHGGDLPTNGTYRIEEAPARVPRVFMPSLSGVGY